MCVFFSFHCCWGNSTTPVSDLPPQKKLMDAPAWVDSAPRSMTLDRGSRDVFPWMEIISFKTDCLNPWTFVRCLFLFFRCDHWYCFRNNFFGYVFIFLTYKFNALLTQARYRRAKYRTVTWMLIAHLEGGWWRWETFKIPQEKIMNRIYELGVFFSVFF